MPRREGLAVTIMFMLCNPINPESLPTGTDTGILLDLSAMTNNELQLMS